MFVRFDYIQKNKLVERFNSLLGTDFLSALDEYAHEHEMPYGSELTIRWQDANVKAVMFEGDDLLLLRIQQKKSNTPLHSLVVGETTFYPADKKLKSIPQKGG